MLCYTLSISIFVTFMGSAQSRDFLCALVSSGCYKVVVFHCVARPSFRHQLEAFTFSAGAIVVIEFSSLINY